LFVYMLLLNVVVLPLIHSATNSWYCFLPKSSADLTVSITQSDMICFVSSAYRSLVAHFVHHINDALDVREESLLHARYLANDGITTPHV